MDARRKRISHFSPAMRYALSCYRASLRKGRLITLPNLSRLYRRRCHVEREAPTARSLHRIERLYA